jgi:outer membrane murein-binding lipoprotein Lpp
MKNLSFKLLLAATAFVGVTLLPACKNNNSNTNNADTAAATQLPDTTVMPDQPAAPAGAVTISPDDSLTNNVKDATKDFPGVTATVNNGEVTLTGTISRAKLPQLMQNISSLHPKKINNNLTIK